MRTSKPTTAAGPDSSPARPLGGPAPTTRNDHHPNQHPLPRQPAMSPTATPLTLTGVSNHRPTDPAAPSRRKATLTAERPIHVLDSSPEPGFRVRARELHGQPKQPPSVRHVRQPATRSRGDPKESSGARATNGRFPIERNRDTPLVTAAPDRGGLTAVWRSAPPRPLLSQPLRKRRATSMLVQTTRAGARGHTDAQVLPTHRPAYDEVDGATTSTSAWSPLGEPALRLPLRPFAEPKEQSDHWLRVRAQVPRVRDFASLTQGRCGDRHRPASD